MKPQRQITLRLVTLMKSSLVGMSVTLIMAAGICAQPQSTRANAVPPIFGEMKPGPHAVGFRLIHLKDPTRLVRSKRNYFGTLDTTDRAQQIDLHIWYPAAEASGAPMTFEQYIYFADFGAPNEAARRQQRESRRQFLATNFGQFNDADWQKLLNSPMLARRDALPATGKFPLLLGNLRPLSTSITNEYLASHGYVVVMIEGNNFGTIGALFHEDWYRNLEFAYAHTRTMPNVDQNITGTLGFSGAGFAQIIYAMRSREVDAVVDLESGFFMSGGLYDGMKSSLGYDVRAMRAPFLHTFSVPLSKEETAGIGDFEAMRYSTRYRYLVDAPQIHHWDFATEGMAASTVLGLRPAAAPLLRKAFELTNLYVLNFYNAYLKGDATGLAFLRRDPLANGAPEKMVTITEKLGIKAPPTEVEFLEIVRQPNGITQAVTIYRETKKATPDVRLFRENAVNNLGYQFLQAKRIKEAVEVFKLNIEAFPESSNVYDGLADAYEADGNKAEAIRLAEKTLEVLANERLPEERKNQIRRSATDKLQRLKQSN
jgi:hypothetical protein